jgi:2-amino-4-hydroxy-6-hydroxymethyldihydropteridine diphosphokinase
MADTRLVGFSSVYESDPWRKTDQPRFLNAVCQIETALAPPDLLARLKEIEQRVGRTTTERWGPREIDLDILLYEGVVHKDDVLQVPHPDLPDRRFVLVPLREIAPDVVHPESGLTMEELATACADRGWIMRSTYYIVL